MRPPSAADHRPQRKLRILYIRKHAPYNAGEERGVEESVARKLCIMGIAVPAPSRGPDDVYGGWGLTPDQARVKEQLQADQRTQAGDYSQEREDEAKAREAEEKRVEAAAKGNGKAKAKGGKPAFLKGKKEAEAQTNGDAAEATA